ncbi:aminotransferase class I/II-fold pyridoxal phosphate-dependent enzyme [Micromonospora sp. NPDC005710]|uniref:aminotransferase class I/II-fold pyridoxal phosphate-dependent enzyme n=1 Tax=Micromonospora sp. NPDC005710 TaxID=3157051 RepID=UPI0033FB9025
MTEAQARGDVVDLADFARLAQQRLEPGVWDFVAGAAGEERTLAANRAAFDRLHLVPRVLTGSARPSAETRVLGRTWAAPLGIAPTAYHTLVDPDGEVATAAAAGSAGLPFVVSTFAGRSFEDIAKAASAPLWLQVYCFRDRATTRRLIERAEQAGFDALVLTVDAPRLGRRQRDIRNGFQLPVGISAANLAGTDGRSPSDHARDEFDAGLDWSVVSWLRSISPLPILLKGILHPADARRAVDVGVNGVLVSNHGGRQLDGVPATVDVLPAIAAEVAGAVPVLLDGGVRRGVDVLIALALGADAVLVGRPVLHGLAVDSQRGVQQVMDILVDELLDAMLLSGTATVADAGPQLLLEPGPSASRGPARAAPRPEPAASGPSVGLRRQDLHASLSDPVLDTMNFLNEVTTRFPRAVSFGPGRPFGPLFPDPTLMFDHARRYLAHLEADGSSPEQIRELLFQYGPASGIIGDLIAESLRRDEGSEVSPDAVVVTTGAQEAMLLTVRALIAGPDDVLLVSTPCYVGITGVARLLGVTVVPVPEGPSGVDPATVESVARAELARGRRPRAYYVVPDHSNPSGNTISMAARTALLDLAARYDFLILEDSPYRLVSPGRQLPTLKGMDERRRVVQLGSYSKTFFPGLRVGFVVADQPVTDGAGQQTLLADEIAKLKSMVTLNTAPLSQVIVGGMLLAGGGSATTHTAESSRFYGDAMESTLRLLERWFPAERRESIGVRWNAPAGGFFLSLEVPFRADEAALARSAEDFGVIWTPMSYFYPDGGGQTSIRLSVSYLSPAQLEEGVARLARFVTAEAGRCQQIGPAALPPP